MFSSHHLFTDNCEYINQRVHLLATTSIYEVLQNLLLQYRENVEAYIIYICILATDLQLMTLDYNAVSLFFINFMHKFFILIH